MPRILLTQAIHPQAERQLAALGEVAVAADTDAETLRREARGCDVIVVRAPLPEDIFTAAPRLIGAVRHGAGVDMIPVEMASAHGVLVANVPGVNAVSVAEHVLLKLLQLARRSAALDTTLRSAGWQAARALADAGSELAGRSLGLVGYGHVGQAVARLCAAGPVDAGAGLHASRPVGRCAALGRAGSVVAGTAGRQRLSRAGLPADRATRAASSARPSWRACVRVPASSMSRAAR